MLLSHLCVDFLFDFFLCLFYPFFFPVMMYSVQEKE